MSLRRRKKFLRIFFVRLDESKYPVFCSKIKDCSNKEQERYSFLQGMLVCAFENGLIDSDDFELLSDYAKHICFSHSFYGNLNGIIQLNL